MYKLMLLTTIAMICLPPFFVTPNYEPIGACIFINGECRMESPTRCGLFGGSYQGDGVWCDPAPLKK